MKFPDSTRYGKVMVQVNNLFVKESIKSFPIDPFRIIDNNKWGLITYSELAQEQGVTVKDIVAAFQSEDGYTIFDGINYTIAYNDTIPIIGRIRFTLMHEIGHICLNHLVDFDETILLRSALTEAKYKVLENEANIFARNALAPVMVVKGLNLKYIKEVMKYFEITKAAAKVRLEALRQDYIRLSGQFISFQREHFQTFVHSILHSKTCLKCNLFFVYNGFNFCPNCGGSNLHTHRRGEDFNMIYPGVEVDKNSRVTKCCPRCQNEEINYNGNYCSICCAYMINECTNNDYDNIDCGTLPGNARYCIHCGSKSTFYLNGYLLDWDHNSKIYVPDTLPF